MPFTTKKAAAAKLSTSTSELSKSAEKTQVAVAKNTIAPKIVALAQIVTASPAASTPAAEFDLSLMRLFN
jgi:hypothetical protein